MILNALAQFFFSSPSFIGFLLGRVERIPASHHELEQKRARKYLINQIRCTDQADCDVFSKA